MFESLIVIALVLWSAAVVFKKLFPQSVNIVLAALSNRCEKLGWQRAALWLKPKMVVGCGGSCGCATDEKAKPEPIQTVKWR